MIRKVDRDNVFLCTIKRCLDIEGYNKYGDSNFVPFCKINSMVDGTEVCYTEIMDNEAIVIRINDDYYMKLDDIEKSKILLKRNCYLATFPSKTGDLFVDKKTLIPYFGEITGSKEKVNTKTLVKKEIK